MKKEAFNELKRESIYIGALFIIFLIIFKIIFFKESFFIVLRAVFSIFWLFVFPGYSIMLYWNDKLDFAERLVIGVALSAAVIGISSYYIGLIGLNVKYHSILLPIILISSGIFLFSRNK